MFHNSIFALALLSGASAFAPSMDGARIKTTTETMAVSISSEIDYDTEGLVVQSQQQGNSIFDPMGLYSENSEERQQGRIRVMESDTSSYQAIVRDPLSLYQDASELTEGVAMSASLPFLKRPTMLDGSLPGDRGFDPFNFSSDAASLSWYRDAEIKHARLAMLATVGWPLAELSHKSVAATFDLEPALGLHDRAPSLVNGGLGLTNPLFWVAAISAAAALEFVSTKNGNSLVQKDEPGDLGFDPFSLGKLPLFDRFAMQEAEIFNGRLAMMAITGFVAQEFYTNTAIIDQTPFFFKPMFGM